MITYRQAWMGLAMLWIMFFHAWISIPSRAINFVKDLGYGGVDIFLFASGIGNYYSYLRDESPLDFLKRRIYRLAPAYLPFIVLWCIVEVIRGKLNPFFIVGNVFGIQDFSASGKSFNWYLTAIVICYLLTPYFASFVKKNNLKNNCVFVAILVILSTAFWNDNKFIISVTRLPIYVIGMICAKWDDKQIMRKHALTGALLGFFGFVLLALAYKYQSKYLWAYGFHWYPFIIITPFLCYAISLAAMNFEKNTVLSVLSAAIQSIGNCSFELYLVHIFVFDIVESIIQKYELYNNNWIWLITFMIVFPSAYALKYIANGIHRKLKNV